MFAGGFSSIYFTVRSQLHYGPMESLCLVTPTYLDMMIAPGEKTFYGTISLTCLHVDNMELWILLASNAELNI